MSKTPTIKTLDTRFLGQTHVIANYLMESEDGLLLVETGPVTVFEHLKKAMADQGYYWKDVKHVLLTHIHFDHAGGAWKFAENGAKIYVHPIGLPHLHNPERLWKSAKRIYKDDMERLWGAMKPIPEKQLVAVEDGDRIDLGGIEVNVFYTPGHAVHHNAYQVGQAIFTGDVAGVKINDGPVVPPCPPPDINVELWKKSIEKLRKQKADILYLAHYGKVEDVENHLDNLEEILADWAEWMRPQYEAGADPEKVTQEFVSYTQNQLMELGVMDNEDLDRYEKGNPSFMSVTGLMRYWKLKEQGRL